MPKEEEEEVQISIKKSKYKQYKDRLKQSKKNLRDLEKQMRR